MKKLRVLALMHEDLVPPDDPGDLEPSDQEWRMEYDVCTTLEELGHEVIKLGVRDELRPIRRTIEAVRPHIAFNLLEEFRDQVVFDHHIVAYLELIRMRYTGCNPRGLVLARDKALSKKILAYHRIRTPDFAVFPMGRKVRRPQRLRFPLIVKSLIAEASLGISQASVVDSDEKLAERVRFIHERVQTDAIAEQYIDGRELYVGVLGNHRLQVLPVWELFFKKLPPDAPRIATAKVKWDRAYQLRTGVMTRAARLSPELDAHVRRVSKRVFRALGMSGYARIDYRLDAQGHLYLLEANPNPQIAYGEDFAESALAAGIEYERLMQRLVNIGMSGSTL